jgi:hypothetical protein
MTQPLLIQKEDSTTLPALSGKEHSTTPENPTNFNYKGSTTHNQPPIPSCKCSKSNNIDTGFKENVSCYRELLCIDLDSKRLVYNM